MLGKINSFFFQLKKKVTEKKITILPLSMQILKAHKENCNSFFNELDCSPGHSLMPGRHGVVENYRYGGANGQEKVDEISGEGNHYTAEYWEYDSRLIRRWNQDPKPNPSISNYAAFANNPIWFSDPLGDTIKVNSYTATDPGFQKWKASRAGEKFYKRYDVGGQREHINVEFNLVSEVRSYDGTPTRDAALTTAYTVGKEGNRQLIVSEEWYNDAMERGLDVSGYATRVGKGETLTLKIQFAGGGSAIDRGSTVLHETQHVRIMDYTNQMFGSPIFYNQSTQHKLMLNNLNSAGFYTQKYKPIFAMLTGNKIYDFNAERWDYHNQYRSAKETDADIDKKAYESGQSNLFMID